MDFLKGFLAVVGAVGAVAWLRHGLQARKETPEQRARRRPQAVLAKVGGSIGILGCVLLNWMQG